MKESYKTTLKHLGLFIITFFTTTLAGVEWSRSKYLFITGITWDDFSHGLLYSIPFLGILTVHEFGHYFVAKFHKIRVTLPYYIPLWLGFLPFVVLPTLGTMGAVIRIKESISSRIKYFDVGVAGPVSGFLVAIIVLWYGFANLPTQDFIYDIHPEYKNYSSLQEAVSSSEGMKITLGGSLLFEFFKKNVADQSLLPPDEELMHYPIILAGYLALLFTALNLLPIGQLDGGHIIFGLFGAKKHAIISRIFFTGFIFYACLGWVTTDSLQSTDADSILDFVAEIALCIYILYLCGYSLFKAKRTRLFYATVIFAVQFFVSSFFHVEGYTGWLFFGVILGRIIGIDHPPVIDMQPLDTKRKILGWFAILILVLCFIPKPLILGI